MSAQDLVDLQPFEGATNRTATIVIQKGQPTEYPVSYIVWKKTKPGRIAVELTLEDVQERTKKAALSAHPIIASKPSSPWLTASPANMAALRKVVGLSAYRAYAGSYTGGLNGVYWLHVLERQPGGLLLVENLHDVGKTKVKRVEALIEPDFVYPLLRGRDVSRWRSQPSAQILMVQDPVKRTGYEESWLKVNYPHTYAYLKEYEDVLRSERRSQVVRDLMDKGAFYSMYAVGEYTFAPYKVIWREQASELTAAVTMDLGQAPVPDHKLMLVACQTKDEAFYLAACLNSAPSRLLVQAYVVTIGISTHILEHVAIPKFDPSSTLHQSIGSLSQDAHQLAAQGKVAQAKLHRVEAEIDHLAAQLWGVTEEELAEMQRDPRELT